MSDLSLEKLIRIYNKMRDKMDLLEAEVKQLDTQMRTVKVAISDNMRETGMESIKTNSGGAYRTISTRYSTADWESMHKFILEHQIPDLLEKRIHQGNMKTYLEEHPEVLPPGLNANMEYSVTIRRPKNG